MFCEGIDYDFEDHGEAGSDASECTTTGKSRPSPNLVRGIMLDTLHGSGE